MSDDLPQQRRAWLMIVLALVAMVVVALVVGLGRDEPEDEEKATVQVTVLRGVDLAPVDLQSSEKPVAQFLGTPRAVVFVSEARYSGSCLPTAEASIGGGTVRLTIDSALGDRPCTADANEVMFLVPGFDESPSTLTVIEDGRPDLEFALGGDEPVRPS